MKLTVESWETSSRMYFSWVLSLFLWYSLANTKYSTGMKCLPQNKVGQAQGVVLHDWHAEIVAIRSFNQFLLRECQALALSQNQRSEYLRRRAQSEITDSHFQPFALNQDVSLHMYCSEAPCMWKSSIPNQISINPSSQAVTQAWNSA